MDYRPTTQQLEQRNILRDLLGDVRTAADVVRHHKNLTRRQREDIALLMDAARMVRDGLAAEGAA